MPCVKAQETDDGNTDQADVNRRVAAFNALVHATAERHPGTGEVPLNTLACPGGKYVASLREPDGLHFSRPGAQTLSKAVLPALLRFAGLTPGTRAGASAG
jgi:lysophospholipase L1-like esterase